MRACVSLSNEGSSSRTFRTWGVTWREMRQPPTVYSKDKRNAKSYRLALGQRVGSDTLKAAVRRLGGQSRVGACGSNLRSARVERARGHASLRHVGPGLRLRRRPVVTLRARLKLELGRGEGEGRP